MQHSPKTALYFLIILIFGYFCFALFIAQAVDNLNSARENELKAVTLNQNLLSRAPKRNLLKILNREPRQVYQQESVFNLPLVEPDNVNFPEQSSPETSPDYFSITTQHFKIFGYNREILELIGAKIEKWYENIINDTGLYESAFLPDIIRVDILRDRQEYEKKTSRPGWSAGFINLSDASICSYEGRHLLKTIPHELTHLIFEIFVGEKAGRENLRWINEGLAVYEETRAGETDFENLKKYLREKSAKGEILSIEELMNMKPGQSTPVDKITLWYAEAGVLTEFLMREKGAGVFRALLAELKNQSSPKDALFRIYSGDFKDLEDLDKQFNEYLKKL